MRLADTTVVRKGQALADDLRERYETSDHPAVHRVEDLKERVFGRTDAAAAMETILSRDAAFDMGRLLRGVKADAPAVVKAFLTRDIATLAQHCGPELVERFSGIFRHFEAEVRLALCVVVVVVCVCALAARDWEQLRAFLEGEGGTGIVNITPTNK